MSKNANIIINVDDDKAINSVDKLAKSFNKVESSIDKANDSSEGLGSTLKTMGGALIAAEMTKKVLEFADATLTAAKNNEMLSGSTKEAAEDYADMKESVIEIGEGIVLSVSSLVIATAQALGLKTALEAAADVATFMATGMSKEMNDELKKIEIESLTNRIISISREIKSLNQDGFVTEESLRKVAVLNVELEKTNKKLQSIDPKKAFSGLDLQALAISGSLAELKKYGAQYLIEQDRRVRASTEADARLAESENKSRKDKANKEAAERKKQFEEDQKKSLDRRKLFLDEVNALEKAKLSERDALALSRYEELKAVETNLNDGIITFEEAANAQKLIVEKYEKQKQEIFKKSEERKQQYIADSYEYLSTQSKYLVSLKQKEAADLAAIEYRLENDRKYTGTQFEYERDQIHKSYNDQRLEDSKQLQSALLTNEYDRLVASKVDINAYYDSLVPLYQDDANMRVTIAKAREAEIQKVEEQTFELRRTQLNEAADGFTSLFSVMAKYDKKYATAFKALAISQAIANTAVGITKAFAQGGVMGFVSGAGIAAAGAAQIATIKEQKFATGGVVDGTSFTGDKIPVSVNSGEMILTKAQQGELFKQLNTGAGNSQPVTIQLNVGSGADSVNLRKILNENSQEFASQVAKVLRNNKFNTTQAAI